MNWFYRTSDSYIDALKQANSRNSTKKSTLSWMSMFNNRKISHYYTGEMHTYQPEDLKLILEKSYVELRKTNETNYEPACLRVMTNSLDM